MMNHWSRPTQGFGGNSVTSGYYRRSVQVEPETRCSRFCSCKSNWRMLLYVLMGSAVTVIVIIVVLLTVFFVEPVESPSNNNTLKQSSPVHHIEKIIDENVVHPAAPSPVKIVVKKTTQEIEWTTEMTTTTGRQETHTHAEPEVQSESEVYPVAVDPDYESFGEAVPVSDIQEITATEAAEMTTIKTTLKTSPSDEQYIHQEWSTTSHHDPIASISPMVIDYMTAPSAVETEVTTQSLTSDLFTRTEEIMPLEELFFALSELHSGEKSMSKADHEMTTATEVVKKSTQIAFHEIVSSNVTEASPFVPITPSKTTDTVHSTVETVVEDDTAQHKIPSFDNIAFDNTGWNPLPDDTFYAWLTGSGAVTKADEKGTTGLDVTKEQWQTTTSGIRNDGVDNNGFSKKGIKLTTEPTLDVDIVEDQKWTITSSAPWADVEVTQMPTVYTGAEVLLGHTHPPISKFTLPHRILSEFIQLTKPKIHSHSGTGSLGTRLDGHSGTGNQGTRPDAQSGAGSQGQRPDGQPGTGSQGQRPDGQSGTGSQGQRPDVHQEPERQGSLYSDRFEPFSSGDHHPEETTKSFFEELLENFKKIPVAPEETESELDSFLEESKADTGLSGLVVDQLTTTVGLSSTQSTAGSLTRTEIDASGDKMADQSASGQETDVTSGPRGGGNAANFASFNSSLEEVNGSEDSSDAIQGTNVSEVPRDSTVEAVNPKRPIDKSPDAYGDEGNPVAGASLENSPADADAFEKGPQDGAFRKGFAKPIAEAPSEGFEIIASEKVTLKDDGHLKKLQDGVLDKPNVEAPLERPVDGASAVVVPLKNQPNVTSVEVSSKNNDHSNDFQDGVSDEVVYKAPLKIIENEALGGDVVKPSTEAPLKAIENGALGGDVVKPSTEAPLESPVEDGYDTVSSKDELSKDFQDGLTDSQDGAVAEVGAKPNAEAPLESLVDGASEEVPFKDDIFSKDFQDRVPELQDGALREIAAKPNTEAPSEVPVDGASAEVVSLTTNQDGEAVSDSGDSKGIQDGGHVEPADEAPLKNLQDGVLGKDVAKPSTVAPFDGPVDGTSGEAVPSKELQDGVQDTQQEGDVSEEIHLKNVTDDASTNGVSTTPKHPLDGAPIFNTLKWSSSSESSIINTGRFGVLPVSGVGTVQEVLLTVDEEEVGHLDSGSVLMTSSVTTRPPTVLTVAVSSLRVGEDVTNRNTAAPSVADGGESRPDGVIKHQDAQQSSSMASTVLNIAATSAQSHFSSSRKPEMLLTAPSVASSIEITAFEATVKSTAMTPQTVAPPISTTHVPVTSLPLRTNEVKDHQRGPEVRENTRRLI